MHDKPLITRVLELVHVSKVGIQHFFRPKEVVYSNYVAPRVVGGQNVFPQEPVNMRLVLAQPN
jgi:hypothetical protein